MIVSFRRTILTEKICLALISTFLCLSLWAQKPGYKFFNLLEDNEPVRINTLYKNKDGYLLAGTTHGLYKFDGENFKKIYFLNKDYSDTVTAIFEDNLRKIWVGFANGRLAHVINGQLAYYNPEEGTAAARITDILQDREGTIWYSAYGEGIYYIKNGRHYLINAEEGLSDQSIHALALTSQGDVLAATDQGLNICSIKNGIKKVVTIGPAQGLPDYIVTNITAAGGDRYWLSLQDKGFCMYDHASKKVLPLSISQGWKYNQVNDLLPDGGDLLIATEQNGLLKYSVSKQHLEQVPDVSLTNVRQLLKDKQGNAWLTTPEKGLLRIPGQSMRLYPLYPPSYFEIIHAIMCSSNGDIWVNDDMAIRRFSASDKVYAPDIIKIPGLLYTSDITALYEDKFKNIWIATMGQGLYVLNPRRRQLRQVDETPAFKNASVLSLSGSGDTIFACSMQGVAFISLQPANENINARYNFQMLDEGNSSAHFIYSIYKDSKNRLWFATDGMGIFMREANGGFTYFEDKRVSENHVYSIAEDKTGNIWFSTAQDGIYKFDGSIFSNYGLKEGLSDLQISVIKCLPSGHMAIVNKKGLDILDPKTGHIFYLNSSMGLGAINADNPGAVTTDNGGNILVTTSMGILAYNVHEGSTQRPVTLIETVELFDGEIDPTATVKFSHAENNFSFSFTGLYYTDPSQVYYRYKLEGLDSNWVITKDRTQTFAKLQPGKYSFRVQSSLSKNFADAHEAHYSFSIKRPFYQSAWFITAVTLLLAGAMFGYVKNREKALKKIQRLESEKMESRFEVLRNQVNPHFLFNSFNTLISAIEEDPKAAVEYAEQLSDFFRIVVSYRDTETISLKEELQVLTTYFYLQQKRYGASLQLRVEVPGEQQVLYSIPPLTLQLLLENAVKHNIVSKDSPLHVIIEMHDHEKLSVINAKNIRTLTQPGAGMGLQNIMNRFKMLTGKEVEVLDEAERFVVNLPLIKKN